MRCTQRLPLFLSVLALPMIILSGAVAPKEVKKENLDVEPWQLRALGHNHLNKVYQEINLDLQRQTKNVKKTAQKQQQKLQVAPKNVQKKNNNEKQQKLQVAPKKVQKKNNDKKQLKVQNRKVSGESGRAFVQATVEPELKSYAEFKPELWQLRAHGHYHNLKQLQQQKIERQEEKKKPQKKVSKKTVQKIAKKTSQSDKKKEKREIQQYEQQPRQQQMILAADDEIDIAHDHKHKKHSHKKHKNHEDEEHDKYDVDPADELADDYNRKHGGKNPADDDKAPKEGEEGGKAPKEGKDGKTPNEGKDGKIPNEGKDGKAPMDGQDGKAPKEGQDGKAPTEGKDAAGKPVDAKTPADGNVPVTGKPIAGTAPPAPAGAKPAPIIPVQHMGEFLTKCNTPGQVALTFSEGPSEATTQMLEILKEAKARVTFFANATWLEYMQYAGITRRAYTDGHLIGMTYRIPNDSSKGMSDAQLRADIAKQATKIYDLIGKYPKYVRLHDAGLKDAKLEPTIRDMGYTLVGFNLDEADYKFNTREQAPQIAAIYESTFAKQYDAFGRKGSYVVVGYDIPASGAAAALPDIVSTVIRNEYDMVRLDGCNNDKAPYKKSALLNDGFVSDEFSFGAANYVHGQSPVAVQNGKAVAGTMPAKVGQKESAASSLSATSVTTAAFAIVLAAFLAL